jgi:hypothetical protein
MQNPVKICKNENIPFFKYLDAYQRWVRAAHERVQFVKRALAMVDMLVNDSDVKKHRDLRRTEIERSEANAVKVAEAIGLSFSLPTRTTFSNLIV